TSGGLWLPPWDTTQFNGLVTGADGTATGRSDTVAATQLRDMVIAAGDSRVAAGAVVEFLFEIQAGSGVGQNLLTARVEDTGAADWYRHVEPWALTIRAIITQQAGVQILNNVINPDKGEVASLEYRQTSATAGPVTVTVFDLSGDVITVLARVASQGPGDYVAVWDGKNRGGRAVARGIYFLRVVAPGIDETRKVLVVR
ncbi:MAG TPA: FlgD immunoglobulin-like domain containing protein, partial [Spirochaetia bacterium]|nr:FlgD immunoglobulin-like domain containing protein [Spirochaetia bacterium]